MATIPRKRFRIGEVMQHTGLSRQTIHNYTMLGLVPVKERTPSGHRLYGEEVFELIERIKALRAKHTLLEIRSILALETAGGSGEAPGGDRA
ncbi:MAG: MerR family transcriptional regulator [Planctomycetes bacterium]|nr:MerR family transcriptional regulator [Planctomycetota bacterium]